MTRYWARQGWLGGTGQGVRTGVLVETSDDRCVAVTTGVPEPPPDAVRLTGLLVPGLANAHSHAFHRALRGRSQAGAGTFWTWRDGMYALAGGLDPDTYQALARATFAEMALAGVTCVGEFHYLHHGPHGSRYADANEMGHRLIAAAGEAGIRITLLDTLYLTATVSTTVDSSPPRGTQLRFSDGSVAAWAERMDALRPADGPRVRIGAAAHSVRAVPSTALSEFARHTADLPVHVHLSEQRAENEACLAVHGRTPAALLADHGLLSPRLTAIHATHLSDEDLSLLGRYGVAVCLCPTTERDLADGIGPARALADAGCPLCLGSDSHAVIDLWEEARAVELDERLLREQRGGFDAAALLGAASANGHAALGWPDAGRIEPGALADLVTVRLDTVRAAGHDPDQAHQAAVFAATAADVNDVIVGGRPIVRDGRHLLVDDVPRALTAAIAAAWQAVERSEAAT